MATPAEELDVAEQGVQAAINAAGSLLPDDLPSPWVAAGSSAIGATIAFDRMRNVPGGTPKTAVGRPAAAQTTGYLPRSGSMITRATRSVPIGGMPPIEKPVRACASRAVARRMSGELVTAASRARSTRL